MTRSRPAKKTETIEIRLPHSTKSAFMAQCRDEGRTASDALRRFIDGELAGPAPSSRSGRFRWWQAVAAALGGLAIGAIAAPSIAQSVGAQSTPLSRAAFERLDRNHDGVLSFEEFSRR
jgi:hypothetical protein